jgi:glycosyltransferase involved in cell wall biosynthesis
MKLIIQIPCFNEESFLPTTLSHLPRKLKGFSTVEWLVIDDGSSDLTSKIAHDLGVHHVIRHKKNKGLAQAFMSGIEASLLFGADVIVNTDADNQYNANDIEKLVEPILNAEADIVIGARPINEIEGFSAFKKSMQQFGSWVVRFVSGTNVSDAPSGFRAYSRDSALNLNVYSRFTYTLETLIQAGFNGDKIISVPVRVNPALRESRLFKSNFRYIGNGILTMLRTYAIYNPLRLFGIASTIFFLTGTAIGLRFLIAKAGGGGSGQIQSLILASILIIVGIQCSATGIVVDMISTNRRITEKILRMSRILS